MQTDVDAYFPDQGRSQDDRRLDARVLGLAGGITLAVGVVGLGLLSRIGWGDRWRRLFADLYPGYGRSSAGLAVGAAWAFTDGVVAGFGFAWLYNALTRTGRSSRFASQFPFGDGDARQHSLDDYGD